MKTINIGIDYQVKDGAPEAYRGMTYDYISYAINKKYEKGLEGQLRRIWGRIQTKFADAIDGGNDSVELEESEFDLIEKAFKECSYSPHLSRYINILEKELDGIKNCETN